MKIYALSAADLLRKLREIDIAVPKRTEGRTKEHCEQWSICHFLATYAETNLIQYPIRVEKRERPDFLLQLPSTCVGIEVTEAVPTDLARADVRREKQREQGIEGYNKLTLLSRFLPDDTQRSAEEIDKIARGDVASDGWVGDEPEREWANAMLHRLKQKAETASKDGYERFKANWLLIYDNWPLPAVVDKEAAAFFMQRLRALDDPLPFDRVFVERKRFVWQFQKSAYASQRIRELWKSGHTT